jgi:hypothetical protein
VGAVGYKLPDGSEKREGQKWKFVEVSDGAQISVALERLGAAYEFVCPP